MKVEIEHDQWAGDEFKGASRISREQQGRRSEQSVANLAGGRCAQRQLAGRCVRRQLAVRSLALRSGLSNDLILGGRRDRFGYYRAFTMTGGPAGGGIGRFVFV